YYEILGIEKAATAQDIKKAYRRLALQWHPDKNPDKKKEAEKKFKLIAEAYEVLSDTKKRGVYDRYGKSGVLNEPSFEDDFNQGYSRPGHFHFHFRSAEDIFKDFFGTDNPFEDFIMGKIFVVFGYFIVGPSREMNGSMFENSFVGFPRHSNMFTSFSSTNFGGPTIGGNFRSTSTSTKFVNGKKVTTKKVVENGQETVTVEEDGRVTSRTVNG
ncbi:hypothetical protein LOTGIDRAFT_55729, partial [Lottia gigantea]